MMQVRARKMAPGAWHEDWQHNRATAQYLVSLHCLLEELQKGENKMTRYSSFVCPKQVCTVHCILFTAPLRRVFWNPLFPQPITLGSLLTDAWKLWWIVMIPWMQNRKTLSNKHLLEAVSLGWVYPSNLDIHCIMISLSMQSMTAVAS
jgi:small-conductance mechanosensitive channel